jgi:hypothetical protein
MKNIFVVLVTILSILPSLSKAAGTTPVSLSTAFDLAIKSSSAHFRVDYPGLGDDGVCSVELRVSPFRFVTANGLENDLIVEETFEDQPIPIKIADSKTAVIELELGRYVTAFLVSTRDGRSLREVLADRGLYEGDLILHGQRCP